MRQQGFITLPLTAYAAIGAALVIVGLSVAVKIQTSRLESAKAETVAVQGKFDAFAAEVKAMGERMRDQAIAQAKSDQQRKEATDAENKRVRAADSALIAKLRLERDSARRSIVPPAASSAGSPQIASFDRAVLESALRGLLDEIRAIADEGSAAVTDLDSAKDWAAPLKMSYSIGR